MNCVWFGGDDNAPSTSATQYNYITPCFTSSWNATESQRAAPVSENITITKLIVYLDTAPGVGKQYTFGIRDDGSTTAAAVVVSGAAVTNTWTGSVSVAANSIVSMQSVPSGTPTASGNNYWVIEYTTAGQYFLMIGGSSATVSASTNNYHNPSGGNGTTWGSSGDEVFTSVMPTNVTMNAMSVLLDGSPGSGKNYTFYVRSVSGGSDDVPVTISDAATANSLTGQATGMNAGDTYTIKCVPSGTPTVRRASWCITMSPAVNGEMVFGFGSTAAPSTSATNYEQLLSVGANGWSATESARYMKPPAYVFKKLYVQLATAPTPGNRTFTLMDNGSPTALTVNISGANTAGNDTTHSVTHSGGGNTGTWRSTVASSPAATAGVHIGYVVYIAPTALTITHTTDTLLRKLNTKTHTSDTLLRKVNVKTHTADTLLRSKVLKTYTTDALLRKVNTRTQTTDSLLRKTVLKTHTIDTLIHIVATKTHTTNTFLHVGIFKTHTTDVLLRKAIITTFTTDARLHLSSITRAHTTDSLLRRTSTKSHATDSSLKRQFTKTHTSDTLIRRRDIRIYTTDSYLKMHDISTKPNVAIYVDTPFFGGIEKFLGGI